MYRIIAVGCSLISVLYAGCRGSGSSRLISVSEVKGSRSGTEAAVRASATAGGEIVGSSLRIVTANGAELRADDNGFYYKTPKGSVLSIQGDEFRFTSEYGFLSFGGNELTVASTIEDPSKVRLAAPSGSAGCISYNHLGSRERQEELSLICGGVTEDDGRSLGGQITLSAKRKYASDDQAMRLIGVISSAYTSDPVASVRFRNMNGLGPLTQRPFPGDVDESPTLRIDGVERESNPSGGTVNNIPKNGTQGGTQRGTVEAVCEIDTQYSELAERGCSFSKTCANCCGPDSRFDRFTASCT